MENNAPETVERWAVEFFDGTIGVHCPLYKEELWTSEHWAEPLAKNEEEFLKNMPFGCKIVRVRIEKVG